MTVLAYCEFCESDVPFEIEPMQADELNAKPWGDVVCPACHFVIATLHADEPGKYKIVREGDDGQVVDGGGDNPVMGVHIDGQPVVDPSGVHVSRVRVGNVKDNRRGTLRMLGVVLNLAAQIVEENEFVRQYYKPEIDTLLEDVADELEYSEEE